VSPIPHFSLKYRSFGPIHLSSRSPNVSPIPTRLPHSHSYTSPPFLRVPSLSPIPTCALPLPHPRLPNPVATRGSGPRLPLEPAEDEDDDAVRRAEELGEEAVHGEVAGSGARSARMRGASRAGAGSGRGCCCCCSSEEEEDAGHGATAAAATARRRRRTMRAGEEDRRHGAAATAARRGGGRAMDGGGMRAPAGDRLVDGGDMRWVPRPFLSKWAAEKVTVLELVSVLSGGWTNLEATISSSSSAPPSESTNPGYFSSPIPLAIFFRKQKIRLEKKRKHELHYLLPPRSSSPLHRSELRASASALRFAVDDKPDLLYNPPRVPDPSPSRCRLLYPLAEQLVKSNFERGPRRWRCSAPAACWPAVASGPDGSGRRAPAQSGCARCRPPAGGAWRPPQRRPVATPTCRRRPRPRRRLHHRSGSERTRPPCRQGKNPFLRGVGSFAVSCELVVSLLGCFRWCAAAREHGYLFCRFTDLDSGVGF
jgi:hypothetical protein